MLNMGGASSQSSLHVDTADYQLGVAMVLGASMISGLSSALTQRALVGMWYNCQPRRYKIELTPLYLCSKVVVDM